MKRIALAGIAACLIPGGVAVSLLAVALSRLRATNRVTMVEVRTRVAPVTVFVPRVSSKWGQA